MREAGSQGVFLDCVGEQCGVISELNGAVDEAQKSFKEGCKIAAGLHLWQIQADFSSALGETTTSKQSEQSEQSEQSVIGLIIPNS